MDQLQNLNMFVLMTGAMLLNRRREAKQRKIRRWQVRPINQRSLTTQTEFTYFRRMKEEDEEHFFLYTRMSREMFAGLLRGVEPLLTKIHSRAISAEEKLAITLKYLAQGGTMRSLAFSYQRGESTVAAIIAQTCQAIWTVLKHHVSLPDRRGWEKISEGFTSRWNMPLCLGAIDGKHINLSAPKNSGSRHFNYKKTFSIVLMAVANDKYEFSMVDVGAYGSQADSGVFSASEFGKKLLDQNFNALQLPEVGKLPGTDTLCHHYFVGDEAFPLQESIMRPYPGKTLTAEKRIFNYRLSRARRIIENVFGILVARWQIFHQTINASVSTVEAIVLATVGLHNFIMHNSDVTRFKRYCPPNYVDREMPDGTVVLGDFRNDLGQCKLMSHRRWGSNNAAKRALEMREKLTEYFSSPVGCVAWQNKAVGLSN